MSKGNHTKGPRKGRPRLQPGEARERLSCRVSPETMYYIERLANHCGGVGATIDHACAIAAEYGRSIGGPLKK